MGKNIAVSPETKTRRSYVCCSLQTASCIVLVYWVANALIKPGPTLVSSKIPQNLRAELVSAGIADKCENHGRPQGSESLPKGIVQQHSTLEMRPLWGVPEKHNEALNLLAMSVGIKQKKLVDAMVGKFLSSGFSVMLFHYDGIVDEWKKFRWHDKVVHVSAINQTKWWFAKRFLHPDIVAGYEYVFLWDEDLGVEKFDPSRYISIVKKEGLEISQPALDEKSEVHHQITVRGRRGKFHRRTYKPGDCNETSISPPCTGWIEVMAPVFSRRAWRCVWYMIQNDLIHAWGLDMMLGYCAQGDRMQNIGVVDAEYVIHYGLPTLGEPSGNKMRSQVKKKGRKHVEEKLQPDFLDQRVEVRRQSYNEYKIFRRRWDEAAESDECWINPYPPLKPIER